uniref:PH domain-containing protein n=1 Tax=Callorhinchus milii TaxID=7868 RepID=A0A4W3IHI1_CALMI
CGVRKLAQGFALCLELNSGLSLKSWSELYSASPFGIARLQQFDSSNAIDKQNTKKVERRIIRLSDCISISQVLSETPPKEMSAFCISTIDKTYVMAVQKCEMSGWIERICDSPRRNLI